MKRFLLVLVCLVALVGAVSADTLIVYPKVQYNGSIYRLIHNTTFTDLNTGAGTGGDYGISTRSYVDSDVQTNTFFAIVRGVIIYETNSLPDSATISQSVFSLRPSELYMDLGDTGINVIMFYIDGTINQQDYDNFGKDLFSTDKNISTLSTSNYAHWTLNALGISNISKTGETSFGLTNTFDFTNTAPVWGKSKRSGIILGYIYPPYLTIEYTVPDTTPTPTPIPAPTEECFYTNLTGASFGENSTEWELTIGNYTWGTLITNVSQGNLSYFACKGIPASWDPEINPPSSDSLVGTVKNWIKEFLKDVFK